MKFDNVRLLVDDFPAAFKFWRDRMGLAVTSGDETESYAEFGDGKIAIFGRRDFAAALGDATLGSGPSGYRSLLVLQVDDVDATYANLIERGVASVAGPVDRPDWGIRTAHVRDPEGNLIEIYSSLQAQ
jgi:lactoylglutathione lyase